MKYTEWEIVIQPYDVVEIKNEGELVATIGFDTLVNPKYPQKQLANAQLIIEAANSCIRINPESPMAVAQSIKGLYEALVKAQEDINWMLNNEQFLNPEVFNYIDKALVDSKTI